MDKVTLELREDYFYHIFNRGNNGEKIFYEYRNYEYFLNKFHEHLKNYLELYAYCLLPNHFHLLIKVIKECITITKQNKTNKRTISKAFSNFFNCYSKSINKQQGRYGNLFQRPFKRKLINKDGYLETVVYYIHQNPIHHGMSNKMEDYNWSSYNSILNEQSIFINTGEVISWFGNKEDFINIHNTMLSNYNDLNKEFETFENLTGL